MPKQTTIFGDVLVQVDKDSDRLLLDKIRKPLRPNVSRGVVEVYEEVERVFAQVKTLIPYVEDFELITTRDRLVQYLEKIKANGVVAIDTETDGLNVISDRIAGMSIYTEGENPAYIPINHDYFERNVPVEMVAGFLKALNHYEIKIIMHNSRFDVRVLLNQVGVRVKCYYDTLIGAKLLNENEKENSLKYLWTRYVLGKDAEYFKYNDLFSGIKFSVFDPARVVVYPALDALMTYTLFKFQFPFLDKESEVCKAQDLLDTSDLMFNIEMPMIDTAVDMEERGVSIDKAYAKDLEKRYTADAERLQMEIQAEIAKHMHIVRKNISSSDLSKLSDPINLDSPSQLSTVFFKGLGLEVPREKTRGKAGAVDKEALEYLAAAYDEYSVIFTKLLEYKALTKIISTYLVAIPEAVNDKTNRLHTSWNTIGAGTGRFSSSSPNLQNIPSKNKEIRPMFVPKEGYVFVGCDYSAQEPRILADISSDPVLVDNYQQNKDVYSTLASMAYKLPYEQCTKDTKEGKVRRNHGKILQLALSYGMQARALAVELNVGEEEAVELYNAFRDNLHVAFEFGEKMKQFAKRNGYVKTLWGRKRRFPDYTLPPYQIVGNISPEKKQAIVQKLSRTRRDAKQALIQEYEQENGISIIDNTFKIRQCDTQILNSIIQGSAADMTKVALIMANNDPELISLDARPVLVIHDEIILECKKENAERATKRLEEVMVAAAKQKVKTVPFKAEGEVMERWHKD